MRYYNTIAPGYNELYGEEQKEKAHLLKKYAKVKGLLLDIGAGTGMATEEFKDQATCILLDPSIEMLKQAKGMRICAKAEYLPFKDGTFDSIVSLTALHHTKLRQVLKEVNRVKKKGAVIGISMLKKAKRDMLALKEYRIRECNKDVLLMSS